MKTAFLFLSFFAAWLVAGNASAVLIGNDVSVGRTDPSDGDGSVFQVYSNEPVPTAGVITSFSIFDQLSNNQPNYSFHAYVLRPTSGNNYLVLFDSGTLLPTGTNATKSYSVTPVAVQPNDLIASYGRGIPFTTGTLGGDYVAIYYPSTTAPVQGNIITLPSVSFPQDQGPYIRDYAFAANLVPEPSSLTLLATGVGLFVLRHRRPSKKLG